MRITTDRSASGFEVARRVRAQRDRIIERWLQRVREELPAARPMGRTALIDSLPVVLGELADVLADEQSHSEKRLRERVLGQVHGLSRALMEEYNLDQLIREYDLLRQVLFDVLEEESPLSPAARNIVLDTVQVGVRSAVDEFIRRRNAEQAEREAKADERSRQDRLVAAMLDATHDHVFALDQAGRFVFVNRAAVEALGRRKEEFLGRTLHELQCPPEFLVHWEPNLQRALAGEYVVQEAPFPTPAGEGQFEYALGPLRSADGRVTTVVGVTRDITELKRIQYAQAELLQALRQSEVRYQRLNEAGIIGIVEWTGSGQFTAANDAFLRMTGYSREDLDAGRLGFRMLTPPEHQSVTDHAVRTLKETGAVLPFEKQYVRKDGSRIDVLISGATIDEKHEAGIALVRDITAAKAAAEALRRSEQEYRTLAESMPSAVWTARPDGSLDYVNNVLSVYIGRGSEAALGTSWTDLVHPDDLPKTLEVWSRALATGEPSEVKHRVRRSDGAYRWFLTRAQPLKVDAGRIVKWFGTSVDIEEFIQAEAVRQRNAEFEKQLIGIVSHDLRSPISAILLSTQGLVRRDDLDERTLRAVLRIQSSAERANRMVRDLLDFTQARLGGGIPVRRTEVDLHDLVRQTLAEVEAAHPGRTLTLRNTGNGRGEWDPDRIAQVVTNLVTNAVKYSPEESVVDVETRGLDGSVFLAVHNAGPPIPPERLGSVFEPMQRGSSQVDTAGRSVGLGLYIVKQIVEAHSGKVSVQSTEAGGTTFTVELPRRAVAPKRDEPTS